MQHRSAWILSFVCLLAVSSCEAREPDKKPENQEKPQTTCSPSAALEQEDHGCPAPLLATESGTCFAAPSLVSPTTPVLIFLHGMSPNADFAIRHAVPLALAGRDAGVVTLLPLGRKGACNWSEAVRENHCWPTTPDAADEAVDWRVRLEKDIAFVGSCLGDEKLGPTFLAGHSNGGIGALQVFADGALPLRGLAVLHGGAPVVLRLPTIGPSGELPSPPALLLRAALGDEWHHPTMVRLRDLFEDHGWAFEWQERSGGHAVDESDFESLLDFLLRTVTPPSGE